MSNLYITATKQGEGKTLIAMSLLMNLQKKAKKVGYFKPVGRSMTVNGSANGTDGDVTLMKEVCKLDDAILDIGPLSISGGFPLEWVTKTGRDEVLQKIGRAFPALSKDKEFLVIEGTGNAAAGAAFGLSNASLAKQFNCKVLLVSSGGVGQPIDEILLNKSYFERAGVELLGVIINKTFPHETDAINSFMKRVLETVGVKMFGVIPYNADLACPTMIDVMRELNGHALSGEHFMGNKIGKVLLGTASSRGMLDSFEGNITLVVTGDREELIHSALITAYVTRKKGFALSGVLIAGKTKPSDAVMVPLKKTNLPVIWVEADCYSVASSVHRMQAKLAAADTARIAMAEQTFSRNVDVNAIIEALAKKETLRTA